MGRGRSAPVHFVREGQSRFDSLFLCSEWSVKSHALKLVIFLVPVRHLGNKSCNRYLGNIGTFAFPLI